MKWYYFRKRKLPLLYPIAYYFTLYTKKHLNVKVGPILNLSDGQDDTQQTIINLKGFNRVGNNFLQRVIKNPNFLRIRAVKSRKFGWKFVRWCRKFLLTDQLSKAANEKLVKFLFEYKKWYEKFSLINVVWWVFLEDKIANEINKKLRQKRFKKPEIQEINQTLFSPSEPSYIRKENLDFLKLVYLIKSKEKTLKSLSVFRKNKIFYSRFKQLVNKYFWIPWDYLGPKIWDEKYYFNKIKKYLRKSSKDVEEIKKIKKEIKNLKFKQKDLIQKLKIPQDIIHLIKSLQAQAILQDDKKAITTETHCYLANLFEIISKKINIPKKDLYFLSFEEIKGALLGKNINRIKRELVQRRKFGLVISDEGKKENLSGQRALNYIKLNSVKIRKSAKLVSEIKGVCACIGKAKGRVKVLLNASFVSKFKRNEILVTSMTTPDYVPAMKKASAIVTDEGGITCHAAIVSRELNIPCIVGTKIATQVLKDGDLVEVDATKGIVRKLIN